MVLQELYEFFLLYDFERHFFYPPCDIRKKETTTMLFEKNEKIKKIVPTPKKELYYKQ